MLDGVISSCRLAFNDGAQSRASANAVVGDLPLLSSRTENESIDQTCQLDNAHIPLTKAG